MDLLQKIERFLERLECNPTDCNLDEIKEHLISAHELARDGLERSHLASLVPDLRDEISALNESVNYLHDDLDIARTELRELSKLRPVLDHIRSDTEGKAALCEYSLDKLSRTLDKIKSAGVDDLLSIRETVLADFNTAWDHEPSTLSLSGTSLNHDPKFFKSGG